MRRKQWGDTIMAKGLTALWYTNANQVPVYQATMKDELNIVRSPIADNAKRQYVEMIQPSGWTIAKSSKYKDESAKLISWFANDLEAQKIFAMELGSPGSARVTKASSTASSRTPTSRTARGSVSWSSWPRSAPRSTATRAVPGTRLP